MDIKQEIGNRIRQVRAKLGWTQDRLARELKTSKSSISDYELGDSFPNISTAIKISQLGGVSVDWLFKGQEACLHQPPDSDLTPEEARMLTAYRNTTRPNQAAILRIVEMMQK